MRRSKAPSQLRKRLCIRDDNNIKKVAETCDAEDEDFKWGCGAKFEKGSSSLSKSKRIFNIVWRDITNKKHKTWKGDGTLEYNVNGHKAVLKDEAGTYLGCTSNFKNENELRPDSVLIIGRKEIEIQNEITDEEEVIHLRRLEVKKRWENDQKLEDENKTKGSIRFKPVLTLNNTDALSHAKIPNTIAKPQVKHFICFLRSSELQQYLLHHVKEYYCNHNEYFCEQNSKHIKQVLQRICNHPSSISDTSDPAIKDEFIAYLTSFLPHWSDMGPCDSGKLEFVKNFLQHADENNEKVLLIAKSTSLNMLQGLCDFMNIKCARVNDSPDLMQDAKVALSNSSECLNDPHTIEFKKIVIFENTWKIINYITSVENSNRSVYYLVTSSSIEEYSLTNSFSNNEKSIDFIEMINIFNWDQQFCYTHSKMQCLCPGLEEATFDLSENFSDFKNWHHFVAPLSNNLLKSFSLDNSAENILTIFYKIASF